MSEWGYDDNDNAQTGEDLNGPKALREAYKKQGEKLDQALDFIKQMEERERKRELASVFENLGVPGAANVYTGEADPEKAKAWVDSMRGVFGGNAGNPAPVAEQPTPPAMNAEQIAQYQAMNEVMQNGVPVGNFEAAASAVGSANDLNSLLAAMQQAQHRG